VVLAIFTLVLLVVAAVVYVSFELALIALASLAMIFGGSKIASENRLEKQDRPGELTLSKKERGSIFYWAAISLAGFIFLDFVVPVAYGFLQNPRVVVGSVTPQNILDVSVLVVVVNAISEEVFFRQSAVNYIAVRLKAGPWIGVFGGGLIFGAYHLFIDAQDPISLAVVVGAGTLFGIADLRTHRLSTSMLAHLVNNLGAVGVLAVFGAPPASFMIVALL
jgi:membrane protease YdiL (CAAX protease family)